jgi:peptide/nickel transport system permease protein
MRGRLKNKSWSVYLLVFMLAVGLLAPVLANQDGFFEIPTPIPYGENQMDLKNANAVSPFGVQEVDGNYYRHWLGTDELGRDVLTQLIYGSRTAFSVGFGAMLVAAIIGILIGGLAAYFGDYQLKAGRLRIRLLIVLLILYLIAVVSLIPWDIQSLSAAQKGLHLLVYSLFFVALTYGLNQLLKQREERKKIQLSPIPLDLILSRIIEIMDSLPLFFLVVAFSALFTPNLFWLSLIIGVNAWPTIAKYFRAEVYKLKKTEFVEGAYSMGFPNWRILFKHILPNAISPVLVTLCFGVASAILIESSLSFLGLGTSSDHASWGKLLAEARSNYQAWWLSLFPGLCIFLTVYSLNKLADYWNSN